MITKPLVFVSSTSRCDEERSALRQDLRGPYELYFFEEDRARGASPEAHCRRMIEQSDAFVSVLGQDYGSAFPGAQPPRSIVEWEFDAAVELGHAEILPFVRKMKPGEVYEPRQEQFVDRVRAFRTGAWCRFYSTPLELVASVRQSLEQWLAQVWVRLTQERRALTRIWVPWLVGVAVLLALLVVAVVALVTSQGMKRGPALLITAVALVAIAMCGLVTFWLHGGRHD